MVDSGRGLVVKDWESGADVPYARGLAESRERECPAGAKHQVALVFQLMKQFGDVGFPFLHHDAVQATGAFNRRLKMALCAECRHIECPG